MTDTARLRLVFMGSPSFALPTLAALIEAGHEIACVYTQPPRPAGRGRDTRRCPVHAFALDHGLKVRTPKSLKAETEQAAFAELGCDAGVVAAYGLILPEAVVGAPRLGCYNVHASLLPRWRGAAPIQRAILEGDGETGVSIMRVEAGLDTGPVLLAETMPITATTTAGELHDALADLGARLMLVALAGVAAGGLTPRPQPDQGVTYAAKIGAEDERLDWRKPAAELERAVRALSPSPGVWFEHAGERIKVLHARVAAAGGLPGIVLDEALTVACGEGALALLRLQRPGRKALEGQAFLRGYPLPPGTRLG